VHLNYQGNSWSFRIAGLSKDDMLPAAIDYPIDPDTTYYFNVQNTANADDGYYLRLSYHGNGTTLIT